MYPLDLIYQALMAAVVVQFVNVTVVVYTNICFTTAHYVDIVNIAVQENAYIVAVTKHSVLSDSYNLDNETTHHHVNL